MEQIELIEVNSKYADDIWKIRQEILECGAENEDQFAGCMSLDTSKSAEEWIKVCELRKSEDNCNEVGTAVPSYMYIAVRIVAERNGIICGIVCVDYVNKPETPYSKARSFYHVQEIAVDANHRRQGVAKELLEFMIADAKKRKLGKIELDVWEFNDSAIEFYQAVGFKQTRRWMEYEVD